MSARSEAGEGEEAIGGGLSDDGAGVGGVERLQDQVEVVDILRTATGVPTDGGTDVSNVVGIQGVDVGAGVGEFKGNLIDVGIPRGGGSQSADGHIVAVASVRVEGGVDLLPVGTDSGCAHGLEGSGVVGVGHDSDVEGGMVGGRACLGPELQLECIDGLIVRIHTGEDHILVIAVCGSGGVVVPVQTTGAAVVAVGRAGGDIGVAAIHGTVVEVAPAGQEVVAVGAADGSTLEVFE